MVPNINTDDGRYLDVGYASPLELSSVWGNSENVGQLLPAVYGYHGDYSFHTAMEQNPFVVVDLQHIRLVKRLRIFNRESFPDRAIPLVISASLDKESWIEVARINYAFGGRITGEPLDLKFFGKLRSRYFKFQIINTTYLHLDYIEISTTIPELELGKLLNIDCRGSSITAEYFHHNSYGFSWTFTQTLRAISLCRSHGITVSRVNYSACLVPFKNSPTSDIYPLLFKPPSVSTDFTKLSPVNFFHHGIYATLDLTEINRYASIYFTPSAAAEAIMEAITKKYAIQEENSIALVYRGTDKSSEVTPVPIERYIDWALAALRRRPNLQVIIQTDQEQALQAVLNAIPQAIFFQELPVTTGTTVMHKLSLESDFAISKSAFALHMLAVIRLLATVKYVVTHTGNIGLWLAFYRGSSDGFYQFDKDTKLRDPLGKVVTDWNELEIA